MSSVRTEGPIPAGGAYSITEFLDGQGNAVDQPDATRQCVVEYTADEQIVRWTYSVVESAVVAG